MSTAHQPKAAVLQQLVDYLELHTTHNTHIRTHARALLKSSRSAYVHTEIQLHISGPTGCSMLNTVLRSPAVKFHWSYRHYGAGANEIIM